MSNDQHLFTAYTMANTLQSRQSSAYYMMWPAEDPEPLCWSLINDTCQSSANNQFCMGLPWTFHSRG